MKALFTTALQHSFGSPSHSNQTDKRKKKGIQIGREEVKLSLYADMTLYIKNPNFTQKLLDQSIQQSSRIQD